MPSPALARQSELSANPARSLQFEGAPCLPATPTRHPQQVEIIHNLPFYHRHATREELHTLASRDDPDPDTRRLVKRTSI
jgi:hypothetical protein